MRRIIGSMRARRGLLLSLFASVLITVPISTRAQGGTSLQPTLATSSILAPTDSETPRCRSLECVRRRLDASTTVRLEGEFGRFTGHVTRWDADSLAGFEVDPDWGGSAPAAPISWSQISNVDQRVSNKGRGAVVGAVSLGLITAVYAATVIVRSTGPFLAFDPDANKSIGQTALAFGLIGGALGAGIGAGIGSYTNRWEPIYRR